MNPSGPHAKAFFKLLVTTFALVVSLFHPILVVAGVVVAAIGGAVLRYRRKTLRDERVRRRVEQALCRRP